MTEDTEPLELVRLDDGTQSVVVRVLSTQPHRPDHYDAEIVIRSDFVNAVVRTDFDADDIGEWGDLLDAVEDDDADIQQDDDVLAESWPSEGRAAYLTFVADDPYVVEVHDAPGTQICVRVPLDLKPDWIADSRARLAAVRRALGV
ncbi:DUF5959 family protein [Streptomyces sp. Q6]|uniref:DUF5959 family protein n=1 Tax=Streptomyces citrinus TaxID=3118173 RepID=A0ACD5ADY6_9ACTN